MTTRQNQSVAATLTAAVSTAIEASQKLTDALKAISEIVSTGSQSKPEGTTTKSSDSSISVTPKRKPGRPRKTSTTLPETQSAKHADPVTVSVQPGVPAETKKRGASPEVLAKARAAAKAKREANAVKGHIVEAATVMEVAKWPFPTSTKYNSDGTEKDTTGSSH